MKRHLSIWELFEILQIEYIVCELRANIYPLLKHKQYWRDTAEKKKEKIKDISNRNNLPTIFDDKKIRETFNKKVYNIEGFPNFYYPDEKKKEQQAYWDFVNYYAIGEMVRFEHEKELKTSKITFFDKDSRMVEVEVGSKVILLPFSKVTRIL